MAFVQPQGAKASSTGCVVCQGSAPSHLGRQLLGLALNAPENIQHPPSEGSRLHGLFDEDRFKTGRVRGVLWMVIAAMRGWAGSH